MIFFQNFIFFVTRITFGALHNSENKKNRKSDDFDLNRFSSLCSLYNIWTRSFGQPIYNLDINTGLVDIPMISNTHRCLIMARYARLISGVIGGINSYVQIIMKTFHSILEDAKFSVH